MSFTQTLILTRAYMPHEIVSWQDAITRMFRGTVEILVQYDEIVTVIGPNHLKSFPELRRALRQVVGTETESLTIKVPAVAVLRRKVRSVKSGVKFSKLNVCLRDNFSCQYCGAVLPMSQLEYEHVVPRGKGGKTVWDNIVMACTACNSYKANRTPKEAGMLLLTVPRQPKTLPLCGPRIDPQQAPEEWFPFLKVA